MRHHGPLFGPRALGQLNSIYPAFVCQVSCILYFPPFCSVSCRAVLTHTHDTIRSKLRQPLTHTVPPSLTDPLSNIPRPASAAEDDELPGGTWSPLLMLLPGADGPQRARRDGLETGVQHCVLQARVVADLFFTTATLTYAGLGFGEGFARLVALFAHCAGVALFANKRTFACIAFNDEKCV